MTMYLLLKKRMLIQFVIIYTQNQLTMKDIRLALEKALKRLNVDLYLQMRNRGIKSQKK